MSTDPFAQFKAVQREGWSHFVPLATFTTPPAASLVEFAQVESGNRVLDVACGTGVVAVTAARAGAKVRGLDLSPVLLEEARRNAQLAGVDAEFREGDVEALPYSDGEFDAVLSQFGHMFAPRPDVALKEMLRVLKPGGRIAFSTWPPELFVGGTFALVGRHMRPPPGVAPPPLWGDPSVVRERLGDAVTDVEFDRREMLVPALSPSHYRANIEQTVAPAIKLVAMLQNEAAKLAAFRNELEALISRWFSGNCVHQGFLMTRARKR